ncbi:TRAPP trafficking subunit Trs65-domain-containing protein, partial [Xylariales sp. AK1849]
MADLTGQPSSTSGLDFIASSSLTYLIPLATEFKVKEAFEGTVDSVEAALGSVEHRDSLFFDESVNVYLVLKTPFVGEKILKSSLRRLVVSLEAQIVNSNAPDRDSPPASEVIYHGTVEEADEPFVVSDHGDGFSGNDGQIRPSLVIWKLTVFLARPRIRLQGPSAVFVATASLKPAELSLSSGLRDGYLTSGVASGLNLLESFGNDPALGGIQPRLSALRVSRVAPLTQRTKDLLQPIKSSPKQLALRIYPAVHCRIRFARPNTTPPSPAIIAMLEVDFTPFFECEIALTAITMSVSDGVVEDLTSQPAMALPMSCVAHDHVTFLYRITPEEPDVLARNSTSDLNITISATALDQPGICTPKLTMAWTTTVDFTLPVNPGFGAAMQPIQRSHRPSQLSINSMTSLTAPAVARPDALPLLEAATNKTEASIPDLGITMTFTAPPPTQKIYPGDIFVWTIFVVNRVPSTSTAVPRKLALVVIPKRRRNENRVNRPPSVSRPPTAAHGPSQPKTPRDRSVADAILDENVVHAMQRSSVVDSAEVVCLSADVRVGPLAPGACHVVELRFLALKPGIVGIEAVRAVDLGSTEHVDIRELPTVVVEQQPGEEEHGNA